MVRKQLVELPDLKPINTMLMRVGVEVFAVYGDRSCGFSAYIEDFYPNVPQEWRYQTEEELFFALANFNICPEGIA